MGGQKVDPAVLDAAYADYVAGDRYKELVERYGVSRITLQRAFRARGLKGSTARRCGEVWRPVRESDPYGLYILGLLRR